MEFSHGLVRCDLVQPLNLQALSDNAIGLEILI